MSFFFSEKEIIIFHDKLILWLGVLTNSSVVRSSFTDEPHNSVSSVQDWRIRGRWLDPLLCQYSFQGLETVIATGFIPLSRLSFGRLSCGKAGSGFEKDIVLIKRNPRIDGYVRYK